MENSVSIMLQEKNLEALVKNGGFRFNDTFFIYTSGKIGPYYVNAENVMNNEEDYANAINSITTLIPIAPTTDTYDIITGGERRDLIFSFPVAYHLRKTPAALYKDGRIIGPDMSGKNIVHVADLNNDGSSPRDFWIPMIRESGGIIENIFFYVDRLEDGVDVMDEIGLNSYAVIPLNETAWNCLSKWRVISKKNYNVIKERMECREDWAKRMLLSDAGLKQLGEYLRDDKMKERAEKVLEIGYPNLKEEIVDRLK